MSAEKLSQYEDALSYCHILPSMWIFPPYSKATQHFKRPCPLIWTLYLAIFSHKVEKWQYLLLVIIAPMQSVREGTNKLCAAPQWKFIWNLIFCQHFNFAYDFFLPLSLHPSLPLFFPSWLLLCLSPPLSHSFSPLSFVSLSLLSSAPLFSPLLLHIPGSPGRFENRRQC